MSIPSQPGPGGDPEPPVRSLALRLPTGYRFAEHAHGWAQLVYAERGALRAEATARQWIVPPHRSLWVPAGVRHSLVTHGETWLRTVYLHPDRVGGMAPELRVIDVSSLLREVLLEICRLGVLNAGDELHRALATILQARLASAPGLALDLPLPSDPRARRAAGQVLSQLDRTAPLTHLASGSGASRRTLERLFQAETGLSFGRWRQQARLQHAVCRLAEGADVTSLALECGYESVSAFVAMFKQCLGTTPGQYLRGEARETSSPDSSRRA